MSDFKVLTQMGFSQENVEYALHATKGQSMSDTIEWLLEHEACASHKHKPRRHRHRSNCNGYSSRLPTIAEEASECSTEEMNPKRYATLLKCTTCGKMCQRKIQTEYHQFKTGHNDFVEYFVEKKLSKRRARALSKDNTLMVEVFPSQTAVHSHFVHESSSATSADMPASPGSNGTEQLGKYYASTRIQVRLLDGTTLLASFNCHEKLRALRDYIRAHSPAAAAQPYDLMTAFPRRVFTQADYKRSFQALNLVPSIVIIMTKPHV